jgi:hypothetical protein
MIDYILAELLMWVFIIGGSILSIISFWLVYQRPAKETPFESKVEAPDYYKKATPLPNAEAFIYSHMIDRPIKNKLEVD